jgi:lipoprotein-anchoring transpeptidase ErfK/SrfK
VKRRGLAFLLLVACGGAGLLSALVLAASPSATADTGTTAPTPTTTIPPTLPTTTGTTTTTTTTTTPTTPRPNTIPAGVTIAGSVLVGGLSPGDATLVVREFFARPLTLKAGKASLRVTPKELGASAFVGDAVKRARITAPGGNVPLKVAAPRGPVERYVRRLAARFDRAPVDPRLILRKSKPFLTKDVPGRRLKQVVAVRALVLGVKTHGRGTVALRFDALAPAKSRASYGDVIVIRRGANRLDLFDGMKLRRTFGVATGQARYPTPLGRFEIVVKWRNPWWYPPASDWAKDAKPIPPGPGNPLGTRWMGISSPAVGIHGTPDAASIGYSASHGCIRMLIPQVEWLFEQVEVGTPVFIVR